jgi:hypothetical protein
MKNTKTPKRQLVENNLNLQWQENYPKYEFPLDVSKISHKSARLTEAKALAQGLFIKN